MKRILNTIGILLAILATIVPPKPQQVSAQIEKPTTLAITHLEVYGNYLEEGDQLCLITGTVDYPTNPANGNIDETYIVRLLDNGVEIGSTTFTPAYNGGYNASISTSIYFDAASAPTFSSVNKTVEIQGNPTLQWLDNTAATAWASAVSYNATAVTYTSETTDINNATASDVSIYVGKANDAFYFGSNTMFNNVKVNVGTNGNWAGSYAWEYWNGTAWAGVSGLTDPTIGFTAGVGNFNVTYTCPEDWQKTTVNGGNYYWLRFRISAFTTLTTQPLGTQAWNNATTTFPTTSSGVWDLWWPAGGTGTVAATQARLTTRIRTLARLTETAWGGGVDLIESVAGVYKLTAGTALLIGEEYYEAIIPSLRTACPDLFTASIISPTGFSMSDIVSDYYAEGQDAGYNVWGVNWYSQTWTTDVGYNINGVQLQLYRVGAPTILTASIRATVAGLPVAPDLASGNLTVSAITTDTDGEWYTISFTDDYELANATMYAIVVRVPTGNAGTYAGWMYDNAGTLALGNSCVSAASGGPGTWAAVALGVQDATFVNLADSAFSASLRNRLAKRLVGTMFDMTALANSMGTTRMFITGFVYFGMFCLPVTAFSCMAMKSFKPAFLVLAFLLGFGAFPGFVYMEIGVLLFVVSAFLGAWVFVMSRAS